MMSMKSQCNLVSITLLVPVIGMLTACQHSSSPAEAGAFSGDVDFMQQHTDLVVL
jgi:hypothetical protein